MREKQTKGKLLNGRPEDETGRMEKEIRVYDLLDSLDITYWRIDHEVVMTMDACEEIDKILKAAICKNLFLCNRQETQFYLLMMPGDKKLRTKDLSAQLGVARLSFGKEAFMEKYPGVSVTAEFTGSSAGIESLEGGSVDIGNSSRSLKDEEKAAGCVENIVAIDGIAVVLDPANTVTDLTQDQLVQIYKGEVTNWKDLGGSDEPIVVVGREAGSGTRGAFEELLGLEDACQYANELDSTGAVIAKVASTPGAIGYASLDAVDDTIIAAKLNGVEPTEENIKAGSYILSRPFVMATMGEVSAQSEPVQALFDYLKSDEGKQLIQSVGLITVD